MDGQVNIKAVTAHLSDCLPAARWTIMLWYKTITLFILQAF